MNKILRTIARIANDMTQKGASQSDAWKASWKLYKDGWIVTLEASREWNASQIGLRQMVKSASIVVTEWKGKNGNTYRRLQVRGKGGNLGFIPAKFAEIFKRSNTIASVHTTEVFAREINGKFEAAVRLQIIDRSIVLENVI